MAQLLAVFPEDPEAEVDFQIPLSVFTRAVSI